MRIALAIALLLAAPAAAERIVLRATDGKEPLADVGVAVVTERVFHRLAFKAQAFSDKTGQVVLEVPDGATVLAYRAGFAVAFAHPRDRVVDVVLRPERTLAVRVLDSGGKPIANAAVQVKTTFRQPATFPGATDKQGRCFVHGLWLDDYQVRAEAPGYTAASGSDTLTLYRLASIAGTVVDVKDEPVKGAVVSLSSAGQVATDEQGRFVFPDLDPKTVHRVSLAPPLGAEEATVNLAEGTRHELKFVALAPAMLKLRVIGPDGKPRKNAVVEAALARRLKTDAGGRVAIDVSAHHADHLLVESDGMHSRSVEFGSYAPGAVVDLGEVKLAADRVTVVVRTPDGEPVAGGRIDDTPFAGGEGVTTRGTHTILVPGYPAVLVYAQDDGIEVTLPRPRWVDGVVLAPDGAPAAGAAVNGARTDAEGVFRLGPVADQKRLLIDAHHASGSLQVETRATEGRLVIRLRDREQRLVRGRVLRDGRPVERFEIDGTRFVDERGAFSRLVFGGYIRLGADGIGYRLALPANTDDWRIELPTGRIGVTTEPGVRVFLETLARGSVAVAEANEQGAARFTGIAPGTYWVRAAGFGRARARPGEIVKLARPERAVCTVEIRLPDRVVRQAFTPPAPGAGLLTATDTTTFVDLALVGGRTHTLDLTGGVSLTLGGEPGTRFRIRYAGADGPPYSITGRLDDRGHWSHAVRPGPHVVSGGGFRGAVRAPATVALEAGTHDLTGKVLLDSRDPAQGARVALLFDDRSTARVRTDLRGGFAFRGLAPGQFVVEARLDGYATERARVVVTERGIDAPDLPLVLERLATVVRVLDPGGAPIAHVRARINGADAEADALGRLRLGRLPSTIDIGLAGYAAVRGLVVRTAADVRLEPAAALVVLSDAAKGPVEVWSGGRLWATVRSPVRELDDLPAGPVEVRQGEDSET
ncbi:MAG: carboxypeptidase regulatory-like domain-containing protein [Planctomycetota bacterium]|jgi:protocatechuate 3,4-dioxygenase beta subunit